MQACTGHNASPRGRHGFARGCPHAPVRRTPPPSCSAASHDGHLPGLDAAVLRSASTSTPCQQPGGAAAAAAPAAAAAVPAVCHVRPARPGDYWAVADLHCSAFYPRATPFWFSALRLDRVMALQLGQERQELGRFLCLVAAADGGAPDAGAGDGDGSAAAAAAAAASVPKTWNLPGDDLRVDLGPLASLFVSLAFPPSMRQNFAATYSAGGLRGAAVVDTLGEHVPRKRVEMPNGMVREVRRTAIAYLSNLAVAPCTRRAGVGRRLLAEAERQATSWGCRSMALHVDPANTAAVQVGSGRGGGGGGGRRCVAGPRRARGAAARAPAPPAGSAQRAATPPPYRAQMYRSAGYRRVMEQPEWQRLLEGRQQPLVMMMRALPRRGDQASGGGADGEARGAAAAASEARGAAAAASEAQQRPGAPP